MSDSALVDLQVTSHHEPWRVAIDVLALLPARPWHGAHELVEEVRRDQAAGHAGRPRALEHSDVLLASDCGEIRLPWESVGADWIDACRARSRA